MPETLEMSTQRSPKSLNHIEWVCELDEMAVNLDMLQLDDYLYKRYQDIPDPMPL
jgi:hypothetical protein